MMSLPVVGLISKSIYKKRDAEASPQYILNEY